MIPVARVKIRVSASAVVDNEIRITIIVKITRHQTIWVVARITHINGGSKGTIAIARIDIGISVAIYGPCKIEVAIIIEISHIHAPAIVAKIHLGLGKIPLAVTQIQPGVPIVAISNKVHIAVVVEVP